MAKAALRRGAPHVAPRDGRKRGAKNAQTRSGRPARGVPPRRGKAGPPEYSLPRVRALSRTAGGGMPPNARADYNRGGARGGE